MLLQVGADPGLDPGEAQQYSTATGTGPGRLYVFLPQAVTEQPRGDVPHGPEVQEIAAAPVREAVRRTVPARARSGVSASRSARAARLSRAIRGGAGSVRAAI